MQFKSSVSATLALATFAAATGIPASQCTGSTGALQCCDSTGKATDPAISSLLGPLGIVVQDVTALVGVTCSPISVVGVGGDSWLVITFYHYDKLTYGVGGGSCSAQPVCCTNNSFNGVVALGCTPVNLGL